MRIQAGGFDLWLIEVSFLLGHDKVITTMSIYAYWVPRSGDGYSAVVGIFGIQNWTRPSLKPHGLSHYRQNMEKHGNEYC